MADKISVLGSLFEPVVNAMGCQLWGIEYLGQGRHSLLRVYLDKETGVDIEDCVQVSKQLSSILDVEDPISGEYSLEVSSPGLDRPLFTLAQFSMFIGDQVKLRLTESFENRRNFTGQLKAVVDDEIVMIIGDEEYTLPFELVEKANIISRVEA
ncbi:MAG: ribosome maturation factor RimP [Pseudomonadales bacterium]|nr:ribosome maturation factor RimP [Pseudomonadales bacterium]